MRITMAVLAVAAATATAGCSSKYVVHVNGFLNRDKAVEIGAGSCIAVVERQDVPNPLFESETRRRIERLLSSRGYSICSRETADYELRFRHSMDSGRIVQRDRLVREPGHTVRVRTHEGGGKDSYSSFYVPGSSYWVTDSETVYGCRLMLAMYNAQDSNHENSEIRPLWIGEMASNHRVPDLREMVVPMLIAGFEYFGRDTGKRAIITIRRDDPRMSELLGE